MNHVILGGFEKSERERLTQLIEGFGFQVELAPTHKRLHESVENGPSAAIVIDAGLDGSGGVGLLASLPITHGEHVVLVLRGGEYDQLSELISSDNVSTIQADADVSAWKAVFDRIKSSSQANPIPEPKRFDAMLGSCEQMLRVYEMIARVAPTDVSVLICGESGTGKELVAGAIHHRSKRSNKPYVAINCGAIAENLIESELFGHEKSAFTGADKPHAGVFEQADGGTLFLDEITEMPEQVQVRLLRVLENGTIRRVGSEKDKKVDVRVIAATNLDPQKAISRGLFREDVHYRLAVFPFQLPPLRERGSDVIMLANHFLSEYNRQSENDKSFSKKGMDRLQAYHWPGNVRQLRNLVQRAHILESSVIDMACMESLLHGDESLGSKPDSADKEAAETPAAPESQSSTHQPQGDSATAPTGSSSHSADQAPQDADKHMVSVEVGCSIDEAEKILIRRTLEELKGDKKQAAEVLGISLKTLYNRLNEYEAEDEASRSDESKAEVEPTLHGSPSTTQRKHADPPLVAE